MFYRTDGMFYRTHSNASQTVFMDDNLTDSDGEYLDDVRSSCSYAKKWLEYASTNNIDTVTITSLEDALATAINLSDIFSREPN